MKSLSGISILLTLFSFSILSAQAPEILWNKTFGGEDYDYGYSIEQTLDGGYIIAGSTNSFGAGAEDVWLIKTNKDGEELWNKTYGGPDTDRGNCVQQTPDGGFIITGSTTDISKTSSDALLIRTDKVGNTIWTKTYTYEGDKYTGIPLGEEGIFVHQTSNGGYIVSGTLNIGIAFEQKILLIKTDCIGNTEWSKIYGETGFQGSYCVQQTCDGGYILVGYTDSEGAGSTDIWFIKTDVNGDTVWTKTYGGNLQDWGYYVEQTHDGGYILTGSTSSFGAGSADVWLIKTDQQGNALWTKTYGGNDFDRGIEVHQISGSGYIIIGRTQSFSSGNMDIWLIETDDQGNIRWSKTYGGMGYEYAHAGHQTIDGGYIITGYKYPEGLGDADIFLLKTYPSPPPSENLVQNGGFENGEKFWNFYTNGNGSFNTSGPAAEGLNAAQLNITDPGTNCQLYQYDLSLEANTKYILKFSAYSSRGHDMQVAIQKHVYPYTNYGLNWEIVNLKNGWTEYSLEFTTKNFYGMVYDARLLFWFASCAQKGDIYYIDNVVLKKDTGTPSPPIVENLLENGSFEMNKLPWIFYTNGSGVFEVSSPGFEGPKAAHVALNTLGSNMQLYQSDIMLEANTNYQLKFVAYSSGGNDMNVAIQQHEFPYSNYGLNWQWVNLDRSWKYYTLTFTSKNISGVVYNARLLFWFAGHAQKGDIYHIDGVILTKNETNENEEIKVAPDLAERDNPQQVELMQNYPNPFNPTTSIRFTLPNEDHVIIEIYNATGQKVRTLMNGRMNRGYHEVSWNASDMASGIYFYRIRSGNFQELKKMILMK